MIAADPEGGAATALGYQLGGLSRFRQGAPWDAQRIGGENRREFVDYATVAIGLYAAANGISGDQLLSLQNLYAWLFSRFDPREEMDKVYTSLPKTNIINTDLGYSLYQSGRIGPASP